MTRAAKTRAKLNLIVITSGPSFSYDSRQILAEKRPPQEISKISKNTRPILAEDRWPKPDCSCPGPALAA